MIYNSIEELIGNTPLLRLNNYIKNNNIQSDILLKVESKNPGGSIKDRIALRMILDAEEKGIIKEGATIIEPTSGNTGIGLCAICAERGYKAIIVMPETMSVERQKLMKAYGATVVLTKGSLGMNGAIQEALKIHNNTINSYIPSQFDNKVNPEAHYLKTGEEIIRDTSGNIDAFIASFGTGGTISGVGKKLKEFNNDIKIIGVEPFESPLITKGYASSHGIQGIGANFIPKNLDLSVLDEVITISTQDAYDVAREIARTEGLLIGISAGANICASKIISSRKEFLGKTIVTIDPDSGERYLSTRLYE